MDGMTAMRKAHLELAMNPTNFEGYVYPRNYEWRIEYIADGGQWYNEELTHSCQAEHPITWLMLDFLAGNRWTT